MMAGMPDDNDRLRGGTLPDDPEADAIPLIDPAEDAAQKLLENSAPRIGAFLHDAFVRMERRATQQEKPLPLPWPSVQKALGGGLWPGLGILVGGTGVGKSQFALEAALHAARNGFPTLYIGLELDRLSLVARLLGLMSGKSWSRLYLGTDLLEITDVFQRYSAELEQLPIHLELGPPMGWTYEQLLATCKAMRLRYPLYRDRDGRPIPGSRPFLVVLDFLQLVAGQEDLRERIGHAAYAGREVARELDAAVVMISSTSRENYGRLSGQKDRDNADPGPGKGSPARYIGTGKESGEVEYAADWQMTLVQEPWPKDAQEPPPEGSKVWVAVSKVRAGRPCWVELRFDGGRYSEPRKGTLTA
jgi:replicative DNA helicase